MEKKFKLDGATNVENRKKIFRTIINNMKSRAMGGKASVMLTGDPGVGKTQAIKQFCQLVGMEMVLIEAPHLVEEHVINIPFVTFNPVTETTHKDHAQVDGKTFEIVLGKSNLLSVLESKTRIQDAQLLKTIYKDKVLTDLWESMGGTKDTVPSAIAAVRKRYTTVLFVDEFFRQESIAVRNITRSFLNGKIGVEDMPRNVATVYSTNINDTGIVADLNTNAEFLYHNVDAPGKDEWFGWFVSKFEKDKNVKLKDEVIQAFYNVIEEEHLSHNDINSEVRTSPRRWEQILLYVNEALPVKTKEEGQALLTNVHHMFQHFKTKQKSALVRAVSNTVAELIGKTSDISVSGDNTHPEENWRETLQHQIEMKKKLGKHRTYIPIIAGSPGTSKTTYAFEVAQKANLAFIHYDCSVLRAEDLIGIPLPNKSGTDHGVKFAEPSFYKEIMQLADKAYANKIAAIQQKVKDKQISKEEGDAQIKDFKGSDYQFLLFLDEINRVHSLKVFNALRKVLLEKEVGEKKLPDNFILLAAMNPDDVGTLDLTGHMADVTDVIHVAPSWKEFKKYLENKSFKSELGDLENPELREVILNLVVKFMERFSNGKPKVHQKEFKLMFGSDEGTYISPREIDDMFVNTVHNIDSVWKDEISGVDLSEPDEVIKFRKEMSSEIADSFERTLKSVMHKHDADSPGFLADVRNWLTQSEEADFTRELTTTVKKSEIELSEILEPYWNETAKKHLSKDPEFVNYIESNEIHTISEELKDFLDGKFKSYEDVIEHVIKEGSKKKDIDSDHNIKVMKENVSRIEHFIREISHAIVIRRLPNEITEEMRNVIQNSLVLLVDHIPMDDFDNFQVVADAGSRLSSLIHDIIKEFSK